MSMYTEPFWKPSSACATVGYPSDKGDTTDSAANHSIQIEAAITCNRNPSPNWIPAFK